MLGRLFRKPVTRERAITIATEFLTANGCRVVLTAADADFAGDGIPVVFESASIPGRRWYVEFERVLPPNMASSNTSLTVYVWADTGRVTFDHFEGWK